MVDYLAALGYYLKKVHNKDYWYLSPFREEKTALFKVNHGLNAWYDHGVGKGGNLVYFGIIYFNCTVSDFLEHLSQYKNTTTSFFHQQLPTHNLQASASSLADEKKKQLMRVKSLLWR
jgi:DNA primase